jgi:hypothetical protein
MSTYPIKPGYKTTEFWGTVFFHLANLALFILGTIDATWAVTASGIVQSVYNIARGISKRQD